MAKGKSKAKKGVNTQRPKPSEKQLFVTNAGFFPFAQYTSVVGVHTTLLAFTALFLPRTSFLLEITMPSVNPSLLTSQDRPQHPFLDALTTCPISTLACFCVGVCILQGWWGGWVREWWIEYSLHGSYDEQKLDKFVANRVKWTGLLGAWGATFAASFALHIILVLLGAPLTSHSLHTYLLALLISVLMFFTPAYTLGPPTFRNDSPSTVNRMVWVRLFAEFSFQTPVERVIVYPAVGTAYGSWLGTLPIALDWDRPWQAWPLTPALGALLGYIIASLYALTINGTRYLADERIHSAQLVNKVK